MTENQRVKYRLQNYYFFMYKSKEMADLCAKKPILCPLSRLVLFIFVRGGAMEWAVRMAFLWVVAL